MYTYIIVHMYICIYTYISGIPVDVRDERGNTLLIVACQNGNKVKEPLPYLTPITNI
jgi:hypothetical protein